MDTAANLLFSSPHQSFTAPKSRSDGEGMFDLDKCVDEITEKYIRFLEEQENEDVPMSDLDKCVDEIIERYIRFLEEQENEDAPSCLPEATFTPNFNAAAKGLSFSPTITTNRHPSGHHGVKFMEQEQPARDRAANLSRRPTGILPAPHEEDEDGETQTK